MGYFQVGLLIGALVLILSTESTMCQSNSFQEGLLLHQKQLVEHKRQEKEQLRKTYQSDYDYGISVHKQQLLNHQQIEQKYLQLYGHSIPTGFQYHYNNPSQVQVLNKYDDSASGGNNVVDYEQGLVEHRRQLQEHEQKELKQQLTQQLITNGQYQQPIQAPSTRNAPLYFPFRFRFQQ